jgi:caffeoyl-CoA O-methyltransferase
VTQSHRTLVDKHVDGYTRSLLDRYDEAVLLEMEAEAERRRFPAVGRSVGVALELLARAIGATRIFEFGSGFGYSAYWLARAVGSSGEVHCTDRDVDNVHSGRIWLDRAGLGDRVAWHVGDALQTFASEAGEFDAVFVDIAKREYPAAWRMASRRIRVGGLYLADNAIVAGGGDVFGDGEVSEAIREHNELISEDERYVSTILPIREGVVAALRVG